MFVSVLDARNRVVNKCWLENIYCNNCSTKIEGLNHLKGWDAASID